MKHILGVDHVGWLVRDLDATAQRFEGLGFTLSPRQTHSANMGSANHTFVMGDTYVELIGFLADTQFNAPWRARVAKRQGLYIASARTDAAALARAELIEAGVPSSEVVAHARPATLHGGKTVEVAFDVIYLNEEASAPLHVSICQHHNPEHIFVAELAQHANTAIAMRRLYVAAQDCEAAAARCGLLFGAAPQRSGDVFTVETDGMSLVFATASRFAADGMACDLQGAEEAPVGVCFEVASLAGASAVLQRTGVAFRSDRGRLLVAGSDGAGCFIEFREAGRQS